jgi:phosphatidylglycerol:prolipoprotein diacylglycerol transferase
MCDTAVAGLAFGQMVGRLGNFVNMEAFGGYTDNFFAMSIKASEAKYIPVTLLDKMVQIGGVDYIQVHPTFLYEALWSLGTILLIVVYFRFRKFNGEVFFVYVLSYGIGRFWIERLRTDQLIIGTTGIPASQLLAGILVVVALFMIIYKRKKYHHTNM